MNRLDDALQFALESLRLLYWVFFKPFTLRAYLREIDPDLSIFDNPFKYRQRFLENYRLRKYATQTWALNLLMPLLMLIFILPINPNLGIVTLVLGWWLGSLLSKNKRIAILFFWIISLVLSGLVFWNTVIRAGKTPDIDQSLRLVVLVLVLINVQISLSANLEGVAFSLSTLLVITILGSFRWGIESDVFVFIASSLCLVPFAAIVVIGVSTIQLVVKKVSKAKEPLKPVQLSAISPFFLIVISSILEVFVAFSVSENRVATSGIWLLVLIGSLLYNFRDNFTREEFFTLIILSFTSFLVNPVIFFYPYIIILIVFLRIPLWLFYVLYLTYLYLIPLHQQPIRRLRYLPPYFDQVIYLPLPFLDEFIARAYREHPQAALETIAYLNAFTTLKKVAAASMARIAQESLQRARTLEEIAALADELAWIPTPLPKTVSPFLPRLLEVSQSARAARNTRSGYARAEVLRRAAQNLDDIRKALILSNRREDAGYSMVVAAWQPVLERAVQEAEKQARQAGEIPQVYVAGPSLEPEQAAGLLRGRADLFREVESLLSAPQHLVLLLFGGRRTGKTSFLKFLPVKLSGDFLPLLVDLQGVAASSTPEGLAEGMAKEIQNAALRARNLTLPAWDDDALRRDPFHTLLTWFDRVEKETPQRTILLCLDEFERLDEVAQASGSRAALNFLRHVMQHRSRWTLLFSGSHLQEELPAYWSDYLINTRALRVSYLSHEDTRDLIVHPTPDFPPIYDPEAVEEILRLTRGQPYLTQLICFELVELLNRRPEKRIHLEDVQNILPVIFERGYSYFDEFWRHSLDDRGRALLRFLREHPHEAVPEEKRPLARLLVRKEIIQPLPEAPGLYEFQVPLLHLYVERVMREEI